MSHSFKAIEEEIAGMLDVPDAELSPEQRKMMDDYLNELADHEAGKVDSFALFLKLQSAGIEACKAESRRLADKAKSMQKRLDWLKGSYRITMLQHGLKKVQGNAYTLSLRAFEKVEVPSESDTVYLEQLMRIDEHYVRIKISMEPDKTMLKEALKKGAVIPGCSLLKTFSLMVR